jgi:hypothetical protein
MSKATRRYLIAIATLCIPLLAFSDSDYQQRKERIEAMSPIELDSLRSKKKRLELLTPKTRKQVETLHQQLQSHPQKEELTKVMKAYYRWLQSATEKQRRAIQTGTIDERVAIVREARKREQYELFGSKLPLEDFNALGVWVFEFANRNEKQMIDSLKAYTQKDNDRVREVREFLREYERGRSRNGPIAAMTSLNIVDQPALAKLITPDEIETLRSKISTQAKEMLDSFEALEDKQGLIRGWMINRLMVRRYDVDEKELHRFYDEELSPEEREELDQLGADEFHQRLKRMYIRQRRRDRD